MEILDKTKIGSHWFDTKYKSETENGFEHSGRKYGWTCEIWIQKDEKKSKKEVTYLHEIIHELDYQHGLRLKENQVDSLASGLHQVLTENGLVK